jgi:hypothetical protein
MEKIASNASAPETRFITIQVHVLVVQYFLRMVVGWSRYENVKGVLKSFWIITVIYLNFAWPVLDRSIQRWLIFFILFIFWERQNKTMALLVILLVALFRGLVASAYVLLSMQSNRTNAQCTDEEFDMILRHKEKRQLRSQRQAYYNYYYYQPWYCSWVCRDFPCGWW